MPRRRSQPVRELRLDSSHWRRDGQPKVRYSSRQDALDAAAERSTEAGTTLNVYLCPYCQGWHMGGRDPERPR